MDENKRQRNRDDNKYPRNENKDDQDGQGDDADMNGAEDTYDAKREYKNRVDGNNGRGRRKQGGIKKEILRVPCLAYLYSETPNKIAGTTVANQAIRLPIIIYHVEPIPPHYIKRKVYFAPLDIVGGPMEGNVSVASRRANEIYGAEGFNIFKTNTLRYIYPVPITENKNPGANYGKFPGRNLDSNYADTSSIPPFIADAKELKAQGLPPDIINALTGLEKMDIQRLYHNIIIGACREQKQEGSTCTTPSTKTTLQKAGLGAAASILGWMNPHVFLQYTKSNTLFNFMKAKNFTDEDFKRETDKEFESLQQLILGSKVGDYQFTLAPPNASYNIIFPKDNKTEYEGRNYLADTPVYGLKKADHPLPW